MKIPEEYERYQSETEETNEIESYGEPFSSKLAKVFKKIKEPVSKWAKKAKDAVKSFLKKYRVAVCVFCALVIGLSIILLTVKFDKKENGVLYKYSKEAGGYVVTQADSSVTEVNILEKIGNTPVVKIGDAFRYCSNLTSVTIPNSVTCIGDDAFRYCSNLTSITIPNSVTSIGNSAFGDLTTVNITDINAWCSIEFGTNGSNPLSWSEAVLYLNGEVLSGKIELAEGVTKIPYFTFKNSLITEIVIPSTMTNITSSAFSDCDSLTSVTIRSGVTSIGEEAFDGCDSLTNVTIPNSVTSIGDRAFLRCSSLTSVTIPNSVTIIGDSAFRYCSSLTSITIPNSVTSIGDAAFEGCSNLTSVTIGNSVTSIGDNAFYDCSDLTTVNITDMNAWCSIEFDTNYSNPLWYGAVLYLNGEVLGGKIELAEGVTQIPDATFKNSLITEIVIPSTITNIPRSTFEGCSNLTSITIPNSVTSIGSSAFYNCSSLTSITIGNSVTSIGYLAFYDCSGLTTVNITDINDWCSIEFDNYYSNPLENGAMLYLNGEVLSGKIELAEGVTQIPDRTFYNSLIIEIVIPSTITSIGERAFAWCDNLESIYYGGTKEEWSALMENYGDNIPNNVTVYCSNGVFSDTIIVFPTYGKTDE